jgi:hypothetical protein
MATIQELKKRIDLVELAARLGIKKAKGDKGLYHSPGHSDKNASLSIFVNHPTHGTGWKDHSNPDAKGSCVDLVMYVLGLSVSDAMRWLHEEFGIEYDKPDAPAVKKEKSQIEYIADRCLAVAPKARAYLEERGITPQAIDRALKCRTLGFNEWTSTKHQEGEIGYGGPGVAFIVYQVGTREVIGVDMRYLDPEKNGGVKTQSQGQKDGAGWTADPARLKAARRVVMVESSINALSVDSCEIPGTVGYALRGVGNVENIDFSFLRGKQVLICLDNDAPIASDKPRAGQRPGHMAAWALYEKLTALNISAVLVNQDDWKKPGDKDAELINDANDYLQEHGVKGLRDALDDLEPWIITGLSGEAKSRLGKSRVYLPSHDFTQYWRFRKTLDFTRYVKSKPAEDADESERIQYEDLCGFRVASLSRVTVASATATMTGDEDNSPKTYFSVTVQTARHGANLTRRILQDDQLHNMQQWGKFGPIWKPSEFSRMVNILERTADLGARNAVNFVGLAWRNGQLTVNEGPDCYFTDDEKQCPYHNLTFPSGPVRDAARVISAYQTTFKQNAATLPLVWALGGHMKAILGFWPHMTVQADKGAGKSTLIKRLERTLAFRMYSGQSIQTEFRQVTSVSHTSHPIGWEELSARRQDVIDKAVALLQESYQYTVTTRGADMTEYVLSAPVLLAGEDVPVKGILGKIVRTTLTGKKGPKMPDDLPRFPLREWLVYLSELDPRDVMAKYETLRDHCLKNSRSTDDGAQRMAGNYAALLLAWRYLAEFAGIDNSTGGFGTDLMAEMNSHISESDSDRSPWVWIMETILSEMDAGAYRHPYKFDMVEGEECLLIRAGHVMDHIAHSNHLREKWNGLPVKSATVFKKQLVAAGVTLEKEVEKTIHLKRVAHLTAIPLSRLAKFGLSVGISKDITPPKA